MKPPAFSIVVLGASAGGVQALSTVLSGLPAELNAAVFVVLHIPAHTRSHLDSILQRVSRMKVHPAVDWEPIIPGHVYVAQADCHLMVDTDIVRLTRGPKECRSRPAIDALFRSAAAAYGHRVIGVVLPGTLDDGTAGLWAIKDHGGIALVQDPATAEYGSMPQSALEHVKVDAVLPLHALADEIVRQASVSSSTYRPETDLKNSVHIENLIAMEGNGLQAGVMSLGKISGYTCPDCHGVLVQVEEGLIVRFRCHTGHAFSLKTLLFEVNQSIDKGLWDTLRAVEERILLLRQMGLLAEKSGRSAVAAQSAQDAADAESKLKSLRELVRDPALFGHPPDK